MIVQGTFEYLPLERELSVFGKGGHCITEMLMGGYINNRILLGHKDSCMDLNDFFCIIYCIII